MQGEQPPSKAPSSGAEKAKPAAMPAVAAEGPDGRKLFLQHCAGCHGESGDGQGVAAPYLFPKPRNFRAGRFRLVSTDNNVPTADDLRAVLVRGMPGSAMLSWGHLSDAELAALVEEVMRLRREGAREQYVQMLKEDEGLTDEEIAAEDVQQEIQQFVARRTTPGATREVPPIGPADEAAVARGKEIYLKQGCHQCHGETGRGDGVKEQFDDEGYPTRPRDYTRGIFKGGHDPASLYHRIAYGMPGTPMPASQQLTPEQNVDLVHFILSLSDEQTREATILRRRRVVARRVEQLPQDSGDAAWQDIPAVAINLTPLWWRDDFDPVHDVVQIQAAHDGRQVALRLSWPDATQNSRALGTTEFEDGIAVELFRRDRSAAPADSTGGEPFLGMGMADAAVDLWYWDADRQTAADVIQAAYPRSVVDLYPLSEKVVETAELDRPGARAESQPPISLPAVATGNPIVPSKGGPTASTLTAAGPGTVTFRLPASQLVQARGQWRDGRWQVVMRRVLAPSGPDQGIALEPGVPLSLAIAVWDGAHGDRDGQKLISIWQDLELQ